MPPSSSQAIHLIFPQEGEAWTALGKRLKDTDGEILLVLSGREYELAQAADARKAFLAECKKIQQRLRIATKHPVIAAEARASGIRVLDRTRYMKALLKDHPHLNEALRLFSPHLWRQQLKSRLQRMGLLSVPKFRIFSIVALSVLLFYVVVFRLLPSANVYVRPRQETINQTLNIFLTQTGAQLDPTSHVRTMQLVPITVKISHSMKFDHISQQFIGTSAHTDITIVNNTKQPYSLRTGTRFMNQAGMIFHSLEPANVAPGKELTVKAQAADEDLYGQIIGARANLPAGIHWNIPGLSPAEQVNVYGINRTPAVGGTTAYKTVLQSQDLDIAKALFQKELLALARQAVTNEVAQRNSASSDRHLAFVGSDKMTKIAYPTVVLPTQFVGQQLDSITVSGDIEYTAYTCDAQQILDLLKNELEAHTREGRKLVDDHVGLSDLVIQPIQWDDGFAWIKITVDLTATQEYILDPLSPDGALFDLRVRQQITGMSRDDAERVIRNMPEVERVDITEWPPWSFRLPDIPSHISIIPE
jgi:hypothetical protein